MPRSILRVAADTGGTFTDVVAELMTPDGTRQCHEAKVPSTPHDPSRAVTEGLRLMEAWAGVPATVRASFGPFNTTADVDALVGAIETITGGA